MKNEEKNKQTSAYGELKKKGKMKYDDKRAVLVTGRCLMVPGNLQCRLLSRNTNARARER